MVLPLSGLLDLGIVVMGLFNAIYLRYSSNASDLISLPTRTFSEG